MANIADLLRVLDVLISQSGATEIKINPTAGNLTVDVEFFFLPLNGQVIRKAQYITSSLDMEQEIDHSNPYYKRIAGEVRYIVNQAITASTEPAPSVDHQSQPPTL